MKLILLLLPDQGLQELQLLSGASKVESNFVTSKWLSNWVQLRTKGVTIQRSLLSLHLL